MKTEERRCSTCNGEGVEFLGDDDDIGDACSDCNGTGEAARPRTAHELCMEMGVDRERLQKALNRKQDWGKMIDAFEFLTAIGAVLASWPKEEEES